MTLDAFSASKRFVQLGERRVAFHDSGHGPVVLFLHGCPFSSFVWRKVIASLCAEHRCLAPGLLGLGDTETALTADWSLPAQAAMDIDLMNALDIKRAHVVAHDHGGAVAQLLAAEHPQRIDRLVLSNVEANDNWPSEKADFFNFRHSSASHIAACARDARHLLVVVRMMGDTSIATVNRHYFNFDEDTLREIIQGWTIPEVVDVYESFHLPLAS